MSKHDQPDDKYTSVNGYAKITFISYPLWSMKCVSYKLPVRKYYISETAQQWANVICLRDTIQTNAITSRKDGFSSFMDYCIYLSTFRSCYNLSVPFSRHYYGLCHVCLHLARARNINTSVIFAIGRHFRLMKCDNLFTKFTTSKKETWIVLEKAVWKWKKHMMNALMIGFPTNFWREIEAIHVQNCLNVINNVSR